MAPLAVHIKHAGKVHDLTLDTDRPGLVFKEDIYQTTGVPVDRMKVMVKGGMLKGQTFMVIGAAGELPKPPPEPTVFLEDLDDFQLAQALSLPIGLKNLGNTCYMNATVQAMRAIPELQTALNSTQPAQPLPRSLRDLYTEMSTTTDDVVPISFLTILREVVPQFAERSNNKLGGFDLSGYAQQDAEECWSQITNALKSVPGLPGPSGSAPTQSFVEQYMTGIMRRELKCIETEDEPTTTSTQKVLKVDCNITSKTNYMLAGIIDSLDEEINKRSPSLGRDAMYKAHSRLERLPSYLAVHMVRFAWKQNIGKKAKIMRQVKFPTELDALDLTTDDLRAKLTPVNRRLKEIEKERNERRKVRKRTKVVIAAAKDKEGDVEMGDAPEAAKVEGGELKPEEVYRDGELKELEALIDPSIKEDVGSSLAGLYDLVAIITHKGAAADAGHYIGFVKRSVFHSAASLSSAASSSSAPSTQGKFDNGDEDWYKFDDEKVSIFTADKLATLAGGGEDSSAYVLLYKSKSLA
ncbi:hypothetical protein EW146_g5944 [Bondarzewia mesenterica]|uniref:Ubiquitin carboxyl-terminal hydrolase n=1 Tax=Bondarzewia mesenterica TaxID=1095465 RepID=A0A4S4LPX8_9AGAM|nr:hypothetical protein EW146_g5944 [Bondarzewia mesenterica]